MSQEIKRKMAWSMDVAATALVLWALFSIDYGQVIRSIIGQPTSHQQTSEPGVTAQSKE